MKLRSIALTVTMLAGASVLAAVIALILYTLSARSHTQKLVEASTQKLEIQMVHERLAALAHAQVQHIARDLDAPMSLAVNLAKTNAMLAKSNQRVGDVDKMFSRQELSALLQERLLANPQLGGLYAGWEMDAFDGHDALHPNEPGHDADGRLLAWWFRAGGALKFNTLVDVENEQRNRFGMRMGEFYLCPKQSLRPCVVDPYPYALPVDGRTTMLSSFSAPVMVDGKFVGVAGADLSMEHIQKILLEANADLYNGAGNMGLIASNGHLAAWTGNERMIGEKASNVLTSGRLLRPADLPINKVHFEQDRKSGLLELLLPFQVAETNTRWALLLQLPEQALFADANQMNAQLGEKRKEELYGMLLIGFLVGLLGLIVTWLVGRGIARPLTQMVAMLDDIVGGKGDLTRRLQSHRNDELGRISKGFNGFLDQLQTMIAQVVGSVQKVGESSRHTAQIAVNTNEGVQRQLAEIELVATAVHEMTATAQDVARNAGMAAEAANHADQAAGHGKRTVEETAQSIRNLAAEIGHAVSVVQSLAKDSENINAILTTVRSIAEQTNLLALNAAIEAARAGEQGRGFAVVADEVRNLAQKTQKATEEIQAMIAALQNGTREVVRVMEESQSKTDDSVQQATEAAHALESITQAVSVINDMNTQIASAAGQQSAVAEDLGRNVSSINQVANQVAEGANETSHASAELTRLAEQQRALVGQFRI
ncbi:chemotaxis protein [Ventosimonas gracilis]|uniref:Chemotaxis protein n=1 Tax=Ventosimonas gracilis TaxID=1680762 RepID=A0A139SWF3_9GAMM|nr:methyl-accepting chemotaxis protein [Ventosimonas gracilis]KXU38731.1 chemotaxis protein [Ventosimonas gracilis]